MDLSLVVFVIIAGISIILGIILLISHAMEFRDRPGCFILFGLGIVAVVVFLIWLIATPHEPGCGNVFNGWTCVSPNPNP